nr:hypothetical protein [Tanacetum cinerariifolium]
MAEQTKQQATFTKINQLRPGAFGLNLTVKVVDSKAIQTRGGRNGTQGRNMRLAECLDFGEMAEQTKQQATFTKINQLRPGAFGLNLTVKVVDSKAIQTRGGRNGTQGRNMRLAECLVGDETGVVVFTARNEQVDAMKEGSTVILRNAKIDMYKGSMRLAVDRW